MVEWWNAEGGPRNIGMCAESAVTCWKSRKYCRGHQIIVYFVKSAKSGDRNMDDLLLTLPMSQNIGYPWSPRKYMWPSSGFVVVSGQDQAQFLCQLLVRPSLQSKWCISQEHMPVSFYPDYRPLPRWPLAILPLCKASEQPHTYCNQDSW